MGGELGQTIAIIGIMVAVLLAAYYATKFLAKKGKRLTQSKHIKVMVTCPHKLVQNES